MKQKKKLTKMVYDFYSTGSDDQLTLVENQQIFRRIKLRPKILIDISSHLSLNSLNCETKLLNSRITLSFPCFVGPTAKHRLANNEHRELATVRAVVACSTIMCVTTGASTRMELIADEYRRQINTNYPQSNAQLWFQIYVFRNRQISQKLIERAEKCGYKALVVTVDTCEVGNRECDIRNDFSLPDGIRAKNLTDVNVVSENTSRELSIDPSLS